MNFQRSLLFYFGTTILGLRAAFAADLAPDLRFGAMTHFAHGWDPVWADIAAIRGINTVRDELYWNAIERSPGVFAFPASFENYMGALRRNNIAPLIVLSFENDNYDAGNTPFSPEAIAAFARYGTEVLKHYGSQIQTLEIWNEYNGTFCKGPATDDRAPSYAKMLHEAYLQIKAQRPDVTVLGGATAGVPLPYWEKLMQHGALDAMDALSIHPYRYDSAPEGIETEIAALRDLERKYRDGEPKPIWVTEIGWGTHAAAAPGALAIDEAAQAKFLVRAYTLLLSAQVERVYWYLLRDDENFTMGLTTVAARPKLASIAFQTMARELAGASFARREETTPDLYSLVFTRPGGEEVRVMWSLQPVAIAATGPTRVVDSQGRTLSFASGITLTDTPLFVEGPMTGLPLAPRVTEATLTESVRDFSATQGSHGWSYGEFIGDSTAFESLPNYNVSDWNAAWGGVYAYLSVTAADQHPSVSWNGVPISAVRRWTSDRDANIRLVGQFSCGTDGDGVRVSILLNGAPIFRQTLGSGGTIHEAFDLTATVQPGATLDFAVDPGAAGNINFDATQVSVSIAAH